MPIYVNINNLEIKGNVSEKGHKDWIAVDTCDFEVTREVMEGTGAAKNREWKAPIVSAVNFTKKVDDATGNLAKWACGQPGKGKVIVKMLKTGADGYEPYLIYKLQNCILSKYSFSADDSPEEKGTEEFSLSFLKLEMRFTEYDETGKAGDPMIATYDLATSKAG